MLGYVLAWCTVACAKFLCLVKVAPVSEWSMRPPVLSTDRGLGARVVVVR